MSRLLSGFLAVVVLSSSASAQVIDRPVAPPPRDAAPATGRSTIRGRVLTADAGQPVRRATVRVTASELRVPRLMLTDTDGRYEFSELPPGQYSVNASKTTFVSWSYGQTRPNQPARPLILADNQAATNVDIRLPRGAVIAGRITDELGDPVPAARVTPMRQQFRQGERTLTFAGATAMTNDIGEYRIFGLTPGQYYISAMPQQGPFAPPSGPPSGSLEGSESRNGYAPTFYPGTANAAAAQKISVGMAQTLSEINIALLPVRTATVSGVAVDSGGSPMTGFVQIIPRGGTLGLASLGSTIQPDGTFSIPSVAPGAYVLRDTRPPVSASAVPIVSLAFVIVDGEDITGVRVAPVAPVNITGRVVFEDAAAAQSLRPSAVLVTASATTPSDAGIGVGGSGKPIPVSDDFTFEMKTTPGQVAIRAFAPGWQVKGVRINETEVTDRGFDVGSQGVSSVEIEMTNRLQEVSGTVTDVDGKAANESVVLIFSQDRSRWAAAFNRYGATTRPAADSRFKTATLPPGEYYAVALDRFDTNEGQDPEFLESLTQVASTVSLAPGDTRSVDLKVFTVP